MVFVRVDTAKFVGVLGIFNVDLVTVDATLVLLLFVAVIDTLYDVFDDKSYIISDVRVV